jgi:hypothetical protein
MLNLSLNYGEVHATSMGLLAFLDHEGAQPATAAAAAILTAARIIADPTDIGEDAEIALIRDVFQLLSMYSANGRTH